MLCPSPPSTLIPPSTLSRASVRALVLALVLVLVAPGPSASAFGPRGDAVVGRTDSTVGLAPPLAQAGVTVRVFFSPAEGVARGFDDVVSVERVVHPVDGKVASAAMEALIQGPSEEERAWGYSSELYDALSGESACGGPDFNLGIDGHGLATLRFCRPVAGNGIGGDARIWAQVRATLLQFPTIREVRVINRSGGCLGDQSGYEFCLQTNPLTERPLPDTPDVPIRGTVMRYDLLEARARAEEDPELVRPRATERAVVNVRRLVDGARARGERIEPLLEWVTFCGWDQAVRDRVEADAVEMWSYRVYDREGRLLRTEPPERVAQTMTLLRGPDGELRLDGVRYYPDGTPPSCR